jgi:hypothetical protein
MLLRFFRIDPIPPQIEKALGHGARIFNQQRFFDFRYE